MTFNNLDYLIIIATGALVPALLIILFSVYRGYILKSYFNRVVNVPIFRRRYLVSSLLIIITALLFSLILLRPQWGFHMREKHVRGIDLLVALDVSRSMNSKDVAPDRLHRAKEAIRYVSESVPGRAGLIIFAGESFLQCPLTTDRSAFALFLDYTDTTSIALQGTDLAKALVEAERIFEKKRINKKVLLLITDGEDHEGNVEQVIDRLESQDVTVYTVGLGTSDGDLVPVVDSDNAGVYLKDMEGNLVTSIPDRALLKKIARDTGGTFTDISLSLGGLKSVIDTLNADSSKDKGSRYVKEPNDQFHYFALLLVLVMLGELLVHVKWRRS
ncbi:MAG: VWA domain-containing protein [Spirochaetes bacterium]|jgi:Ca-activated chloride channel family protein|nr:VWA domain-containing protein [Spirochaetota bacterium]